MARAAARRVVGEGRTVAALHPSMGSEDFSFYLQEVPGCFVRFGARKSDWEPVPLHSPMFDIDEEVLKVGAAYFDAVARESLSRLRDS